MTSVWQQVSASVDTSFENVVVSDYGP